MAIDLVLDQWPYVLTKFDGEHSEAELDAYITRITRAVSRNERYVGITYLKRYSRERAQVERIARWIKETEQHTRDYCIAAAMLNNSLGFRFLLSTVFLIKPMPVPYHVSATFAEAVAFVRTTAEARGMVLPVARNPWPDAP